MTPEVRHLFVYGTLMRGFWRHRLLADQPGLRFHGRGTVHGRLHDLGAYPGAVPDATPGALVHGEIYESGAMASALDVLDRVEGFDPVDPARGLFLRAPVPAESERGGALLAWIYWWNRPLGRKPVIPGGDYRASREKDACPRT
jgi:gamma-glutamylcyclotransferase (GGCT)/AIG2-like uncharacterized protein YtfP